MHAVIHSTVSLTVTRLLATWFGMSMQNLSSQDIMISTMSRLSAPRSAVDLPGTIKPGTREQLAAQWPDDFPPLSWAFVGRNDFALALGLPSELF
jgi:hypothetical protein